MDEERMARELLSRIELGIEAKKFCESSLGRYLIRRAEEERDQAVEGIKTVDPDDPKAIRTLQNQIYRAESFMYWLGEAITDGNFAMQQIEEEGNDH